MGRQAAEVGEVKHAVELEVDENGVEGAASTGVSVVSRSFRQPELIQAKVPNKLDRLESIVRHGLGLSDSDNLPPNSDLLI